MMPTEFDKKEYWHARFLSEAKFEWLVPSATFMAVLDPHLSRLPKSARILHLGSGTSDLQNHLRSHGYLDVTNVDYEPLALERGRQLEEREFGDVKTRYQVANVTQLDPGQLAEGGGGQVLFDLVIDKSTADAISCGGEQALLAMAHRVKRCIADSGQWISLSYSAARFRRDDIPFYVEVVAKLPTPKLKENDPDIYHWCYLLRPRISGSSWSRGAV